MLYFMEVIFFFMFLVWVENRCFHVLRLIILVFSDTPMQWDKEESYIDNRLEGDCKNNSFISLIIRFVYII